MAGHARFTDTDTVAVEYWYSSGKYFRVELPAVEARAEVKKSIERKKSLVKLVVHGINSDGYFNYHKWSRTNGWSLERSNKWD